MKFKRFSIVFALMLVLSTLFSSFVSAESNGKLNLVALGDSITYGWNLEPTTDPNNQQQHKGAFPYLVGTGEYVVGKNISGGGWTSEKLLEELQKPENLAAIKNADVITLNIGSNDFLQDDAVKAIRSNPALVADPVIGPQLLGELQAKIPVISGTLSISLGKIIDLIRKTNENNPTIILYNIYNPFANGLALLHPLGDSLLAGGQPPVPGVNTAVYGRIALEKNVLLADAFAAFAQGYNNSTGESEYLIPPTDVHPNAKGQQVLAGLANGILAQVGPLSLEVTPATTEQTEGPVTINVKTNAAEIAKLEWLQGEKTEEDFYGEQGGNPITDNKFDITENGKYTVYLMDRREKSKLVVFEVTNIKKDTNIPGDDDNNKPTPTPGDNDKPTPTPVDNGSAQPAPVPSPTPASTTNKGGRNRTLPNTATSMYNYLALGGILILAGGAALVKRRKQTL
ncbi:GDSL-type esterase/lipase family protein [Neobacillus niacini]|uniref:GDSL-type esterase/lipase family protein n=1 Tax=Neobacillus niacini TaxID=86668 RepID=UPI0021CB3F40|nr:GDSL-type esterase/lipase family protein [Neobacillus niacini]MCM3764972.1 GDSL-type esterase/lipase family protein [Neobacillus niacini]